MHSRGFAREALPPSGRPQTLHFPGWLPPRLAIAELCRGRSTSRFAVAPLLSQTHRETPQLLAAAPPNVHKPAGTRAAGPPLTPVGGSSQLSASDVLPPCSCSGAPAATERSCASIPAPVPPCPLFAAHPRTSSGKSSAGSRIVPSMNCSARSMQPPAACTLPSGGTHRHIVHLDGPALSRDSQPACQRRRGGAAAAAIVGSTPHALAQAQKRRQHLCLQPPEVSVPPPAVEVAL
mmetsp:Transcript_16090/g.28702  ORF Transcript_16090/g.28702 Transcript_16090/m.28702 type:complete len:235 (-) Transcript_16090:300-1004(-)